MNLSYISPHIIQTLDQYQISEHKPGLIFEGIKGLGKYQAALYIASKLLTCDPVALSRHPNFFLFDTELLVEDVEDLLTTSQRQSIGDYKVYIIKQAQEMSKTVQNRFLKLLEDYSTTNKIIFICSNYGLLNTIRSRCQTVRFVPAGFDLMYTILNDRVCPEYHDFICYIFCNAPYAVLSQQDELHNYVRLYEQFRNIEKRSDLFTVLHLQKEKDSDSLWEKFEDKKLLTRIISYEFYNILIGSRDAALKHLFNSREASLIMDTFMEHLKIMDSKYTKHDFFDLICFIVEI